MKLFRPRWDLLENPRTGERMQRLVLEVPPLRWVAYMSTRMVRAWFRLRILIFNTSAAQPDYSTTPKLHVLSRTVETTLRFVAPAA